MLRTCVLSCAVAGIVGLAVGCSNPSDTKSGGVPTPGTNERDEHHKAMKAKLDELDKKIADLKAKAEKATGEEKVKLEAKWKETAGQREALHEKYEKLKSAAHDKWEDMKKETEHAYDQLKKKIEE